MKKIIIALAALVLSSSAFACDRYVRCGGGYGDGGRGYNDRYDHRDHRGQNIGREIVEIGVGTAVAVAAVQIGAAIGGRVAQEISGTPAYQQSGRVVYVVTCDRTPFISGGLVYADQCDGRGLGPVVVGRIDRR